MQWWSRSSVTSRISAVTRAALIEPRFGGVSFCLKTMSVFGRGGHQIKNGAIIIVTRIMIGTANQTMRRNPSS
jgi:hypothetical protein